MIVWDKNVFYILQPHLDQSISLARLIRKGTPTRKVVAMTCRGEGGFPASEYDAVQEIVDYRDIPEGIFVIPTGAASTEALLAVRDVVVGDVVLKRNALAAYDKRAFLALCEDCLLPIPRTYSSIKRVPKSAYPIFYKEAHEQGGGMRGVARSGEDVPTHREGSLIFQEYIDTPGTYGVGFLAKEGDLLVSFSHFERESYPITGGSAVLVEKLDDPALLDLTKRVVKAMNYSGWGLAEYKYSQSSKSYVFMEVNAKFWASCEVAFRAQPEFAKRLFNIDSRGSAVKRWFYVNRGMARGLFFMLGNASSILKSEFIFLPGGWRALFRSFIPMGLKKFLRRRRLV